MSSSFSRSPCIIFDTGNAGGARDDFRDLFHAHLRAQQLRLVCLRGGRRLGFLQLLLELRHAPYCSSLIFCQSPLRLASSMASFVLLELFLDVRRALDARLLRLEGFLEVRVFLLEALDLLADEGEALLRRLVLLLADGDFLDAQLDEASVEAIHHLGLGVDLHLDARGGLVDEVDGLVGEEAVGDVAVRKLGRGDDRGVRDVDAVVDLVFFLQAAKDGDGVLDRRLVRR
jgi:hypothetical protein